jgi:uncharacterized repeat protein (TIGR03803 family)
MNDPASTRHRGRLLIATLAALGAAYPAHGTDTYGPEPDALQIPSLRIGTGTYSGVTLTIGSIVTPPSGSWTLATQDIYNPINSELTVPAVDVGGTIYYNAVGTVRTLSAIGIVSGADKFDGATLTIPYVLVGANPFYNVLLKVSVADLVAVQGGMPSVEFDRYDAATGRLTIPAVQYSVSTYTNVILSVALADVLHVGIVETVLHPLAGAPGDGASPEYGGNLLQANDGNFYGVTYGGGAHSAGAVIRIAPGGNESLLYSFGATASDGANPYGSLIQATDGKLYGTTTAGGANSAGTVFRITLDGSESVLYSFGANVDDGVHPHGSLLQASDGNFYGTTPGGGGPYRTGTVFRLTPAGAETVLYAFGSVTADGTAPNGRLVEATDGNLYGMTLNGGEFSDGTVFRIMLPAGTESVLHSFGSAAGDGTSPYGSLIQASDGNLYGMTAYGGANSLGAAIKIALPADTESVLYSFGTAANDGAHPQGSLLQASDGDLYGMTLDGGVGTLGAITRITLAGDESVVYSFGPPPGDGYRPYGDLIQAVDANLYGMTDYGGADSQGALIKVSW